jgi:uncharacterized protein (DUF885 family)
MNTRTAALAGWVFLAGSAVASAASVTTAESRADAHADAQADALVADFVYQGLALQPVSATAAGYHEHAGVRLDGRWDDYSAAGLGRLRTFYHQLQHRLDALRKARLDPEREADLDIIGDSLGLGLLELDRIQDFRHNPTVYVELIGNGLYTPYVLEYAPAERRFRDIIERLQRLPVLVAQATANLRDAPTIWNRIAREENAGNIELIDTTMRAQVPATLQAAYADAAGPALQALREFTAFLAGPLAFKTSDWRLGKDNYERKCRLTLHTGRSTAQLLADAETDLAATRAEMARIAGPRGVTAALAEYAGQHATPATYMDEARSALAQATAFVRQHDLLALDDTSNLAVIETPVYMRGGYPVGGFNPAPAFEPQLGAYYWVTPIPADWPPERVESKLREYNRFGMQQLTIHEAMPGHYVQSVYASRVAPTARRALRANWGNGPYVEGWAVYAQQLLTDAGYMNNDPGLRLAFMKWQLRAQANTIIDIRLQTMGMTDQQALDLMINQTYQEREEAVEKVQRAQLSSCQLAMYYAGGKGWIDARDHFRQRHAADFSLKTFHERALGEGAVPLPTLDKLLR